MLELAEIRRNKPPFDLPSIGEAKVALGFKPVSGHQGERRSHTKDIYLA